MFTFFNKKLFYNKSLYDYCYDSTIKSIQNMIKNHKKKYDIIFSENYKEKITYNIPVFKSIINPNPNPNNKITYILIVISIPSIIYFYYRKKQY
jgi:hypothetical protein